MPHPELAARIDALLENLVGEGNSEQGVQELVNFFEEFVHKPMTDEECSLMIALIFRAFKVGIDATATAIEKAHQ